MREQRRTSERSGPENNAMQAAAKASSGHLPGGACSRTTAAGLPARSGHSSAGFKSPDRGIQIVTVRDARFDTYKIFDANRLPYSQ